MTEDEFNTWLEWYASSYHEDLVHAVNYLLEVFAFPSSERSLTATERDAVTLANQLLNDISESKLPSVHKE
jgi:hypothetical protein